MSERLRRGKPAGMDDAEWAARLELAACYRVVDAFGWSEMIANHITLRLPGPERHYLINPYGLLYSEVTARNLIRIDGQGKKFSDSPHPVNVAGFVIHSALHAAREEAHCILHTHTTAGMAVAMKESGLRHDNVYGAQLWRRTGYHDFGAAPSVGAEGPLIAKALGMNDFLILRNHGLLTVGPHVPAAFDRMWLLQRACEVQAASDAMAGPNHTLAEEVVAAFNDQMEPVYAGQVREGQRMFDAALRKYGITFEGVA